MDCQKFVAGAPQRTQEVVAASVKIPSPLTATTNLLPSAEEEAEAQFNSHVAVAVQFAPALVEQTMTPATG